MPRQINKLERAKELCAAGLLLSQKDEDLIWTYACSLVRSFQGRYVMFNSGGKSFFLHRVIMERKLKRKLVKGEYVDHINRNPLDNRRANLRVLDKYESAQNRGPRKDSSVGLRGVQYDPNHGRFRAQINDHKTGHKFTLISSKDPLRAYLAAIEYRKKHFPGYIPPSKIDYKKIEELRQMRIDDDRERISQRKDKPNSNNKMGLRWVSYRPDVGNGRYQAKVTVQKKQKHLGYFDTPQQAYEAAKAVYEREHGL